MKRRKSPALRDLRPSVPRDGGFTLIEIVVSLAILGLSLTVLFAIFSQSVARTHINETRAAERALATSLLTGAMAPDAPLSDSSGRTVDGLVWRVQFRAYGREDDVPNWPHGVRQVSVTVARADIPNMNSVRLTSLRVVTKEPVR